MAVNWDDYDKSRYFNGKNFEGQQVVTITHVMEETIGKGADAEPKVVVYVGEDPRGLILNVSRRESLRALFGDNTDEVVRLQVQNREALVRTLISWRALVL